MKNYVGIRSCHPFRRKYMYLDLSEYLADRIFIRHKLKVKFHRKEYHSPTGQLVFVLCSIHRKNEKAFEECMQELADTAAMTGCREYARICGQLEKLLAVRQSSGESD